MPALTFPDDRARQPHLYSDGARTQLRPGDPVALVTRRTGGGQVVVTTRISTVEEGLISTTLSPTARYALRGGRCRGMASVLYPLTDALAHDARMHDMIGGLQNGRNWEELDGLSAGDLERVYAEAVAKGQVHDR